MLCPKCYGRLLRNTKICKNCGFDCDKLKNASNKEVDFQRRIGNGDLLLKSRVMPKDVSYKKLLLMCIFGGLFGLHYYYVKSYIKGAYFSLVFLLTLIFTVIVDTLLMVPVQIKYAQQIFGILFAINLIIYVCNIVDIIMKRFSMWVYLDDNK